MAVVARSDAAVDVDDDNLDVPIALDACLKLLKIRIAVDVRIFVGGYEIPHEAFLRLPR